MKEIKSDVRKYLIENFLFGDTDVEFSDNESLMEKGLIDSTGVLELITFLEETYDVKVENEEILPVNLDSLDNINTFISTKVGNRQQSPESA